MISVKAIIVSLFSFYKELPVPNNAQVIY